MLAYMVGLLCQINTELESVVQFCLIVVALQSMFQYWLCRLADQPEVPQESIIDLEIGNPVRSNTPEARLRENMETQSTVLQQSIIDLDIGNPVRSITLEVRLRENMDAQVQPRVQIEHQQTRTADQILPSTAMEQDDDPKECIKLALKVSIGIGGLTGSMIGVLAGNGNKKPDSIFLKISNFLLWASFVSCVILMVLTLLSIKNKQLVVIVKIAMYATVVSLILLLVDLSIVYMKTGNL